MGPETEQQGPAGKLDFLPISTASLQLKEVGSLPTTNLAATFCDTAAAICSIQDSFSPSHLSYHYLSIPLVTTVL